MSCNMYSPNLVGTDKLLNYRNIPHTQLQKQHEVCIEYRFENATEVILGENKKKTEKF